MRSDLTCTIYILARRLRFVRSLLSSLFTYLSENQVNKSVTDPDMKPITPRGHVEFRKLYVSITEASPSKPALPQTFTPRGAVLHTRLFTHSEMVYKLSPSPRLSPTLRLSPSHKQPYTCQHLTEWTNVILQLIGSVVCSKKKCRPPPRSRRVAQTPQRRGNSASSPSFPSCFFSQT